MSAFRETSGKWSMARILCALWTLMLLYHALLDPWLLTEPVAATLLTSIELGLIAWAGGKEPLAAFMNRAGDVAGAIAEAAKSAIAKRRALADAGGAEEPS